VAKDKLTEYDATAANNTVVGDVNLAENSALPSDMNNAVREVMSHLKGFASGTDAIDALTVTGAATVNGAFTSPGIDDNADATAITIDSSERVGIGKTPAYTLDIHGVTAIKDSESLTWQGNAQLSSAIVGSGSGATLHFWTSANERMRIQSGGVVSFSTGIELGSALDGTAANTLDDYEEGTWTPVDASSGSLTIQVQAARYRKIGSIVQVQAFITYPTTSDGSNAAIGGLPFSSPSTSNLYGGFTVGYTTYSSSPFTILKNVDDATFSFRVFGGTLLTNNQLSTRDIIFAGTYISV
jgi:hypothetical protein